ncbi:CRISPR-associated primase-polymerase type B [Parabacteroides sp. W1-Q-101]|uniref:CRISPR-associated primase-polymerase type B n=1 Tax=Parabacteroides TaxID=375288 RepID=UPI00202F4BED|nr:MULTISPECIES: CRISPR-associated primase-polymerase type B [unclassified Parabacteroides]MCM0721970.1 CRISPR-associated primase-polymerase type B [Parabacteroides sp. W1-Q-101]
MEKIYLSMISVGSNITGSADLLHKVTIKYLYDSLRNPRQEILSAIRKLRIVKEIDDKQYSLLKRRLPYLVCGMFNPPYRRIENFAYTEYFVIDIDHLSDKGFSIVDLRKQIEADDRVVLSFLSPSEDGLKVFFKLKERCYDSGLYSLFYKAFLLEFSKQYVLHQVIDTRTSDVTRACFVSVDPDAYYNPDAVQVDIRAFIDMDNPFGLFEQKRQQDKMVKTNDVALKKKEIGTSDPDRDALDRIKQLLNPHAQKERPSVFVPRELDDMMALLKPYIEEVGVVVAEVINIQYGKKIRLKMGMKQAEINLFFGKKGFSVVQSPRTGTNAELNQLMADLIIGFINGH